MPLPYPVWLGFQAVAYTWLAAGCVRMLRAGRDEARGRLGPARTGARAGGLAAGTAALLVVVGWGWAWLACTGCLDAVSASTALLAALSGVTALLSGLSGKPRPGGWFATASWAGSAGLALVAALRGCC